MEENLNNKFDSRHGNLKIMYMLDFVSYIYAAIYWVCAPYVYAAICKDPYDKWGKNGENVVNFFMVFFYVTAVLMVLSTTVCLVLRYVLLQNKQKSKAVKLHIILGIIGLQPLEIVNGIIIDDAKLYPDTKDQTIKSLDWYKATLEDLKFQLENNKITKEEYNKNLYSYKEEISFVKGKLEKGLSMLESKSFQEDLSLEEKADLEKIKSRIDLCNELLEIKTEE